MSIKKEKILKNILYNEIWLYNGEIKENWMHLIDVYTKLERKFSNHGFNLYIVGGTSRDMILGKPLFDFDFARFSTITL